MPLQDYATVMPRLLELRDEEEHVALRSDLVWRVLRSNSASRASEAADQDAGVSELLEQCELKWLALVYGAEYLSAVIARVQENHDEREQSVQTLWSHATGGVCSRATERCAVLQPKTSPASCVRPCVVVNHRLAWAPLAAKTPLPPSRFAVRSNGRYECRYT